MDKNLPAKAEETGFDLWPGKIPHASGKLSPCLLVGALTPVSESRLQGPGVPDRSPFESLCLWAHGRVRGRVEKHVCALLGGAEEAALWACANANKPVSLSPTQGLEPSLMV